MVCLRRFAKVSVGDSPRGRPASSGGPGARDDDRRAGQPDHGADRVPAEVVLIAERRDGKAARRRRKGAEHLAAIIQGL